MSNSGTRIGTLCVIDRIPHPRLSNQDKAHLTRLADRVMSTLEARKQRGAAVRLA